MKGVAGNLGAVNLHASAANLEKAVKEGQETLILECLTRLKADLAQVLTSIEKLANPSINHSFPGDY